MFHNFSTSSQSFLLLHCSCCHILLEKEFFLFSPSLNSRSPSLSCLSGLCFPTREGLSRPRRGDVEFRGRNFGAFQEKNAISGGRAPWGESERFDVGAVHSGQLRIPKSRVQVRTGPRRVPLHTHIPTDHEEPRAAWITHTWKGMAQVAWRCSSATEKWDEGIIPGMKCSANLKPGRISTFLMLNHPSTTSNPQNPAGGGCGRPVGDLVDLEPDSKGGVDAGMLTEAAEPRGGRGWCSFDQDFFFQRNSSLTCCHLPATIPKPFPLLFPFLNNKILKMFHPGKKINFLALLRLVHSRGFHPRINTAVVWGLLWKVINSKICFQIGFLPLKAAARRGFYWEFFIRLSDTREESSLA